MALIQRGSLGERAHWEPFREIKNLHQEMNRLFDRLLLNSNGETRSLMFFPAAELKETDDAIQLRLEVPGMDAKDLDVQITESLVLVKGERKMESQTEEKDIVCSEFHYGQFERQIPLPAHIQTESVRAEWKNGVLSLTLPKVESEQQKAIKLHIR